MIKSQSGVAMMMTMISMLILSILAAELVYESQVYNGSVFRQVDQLRADLLARSGLRLALLQLRAAEKAKEKAKAMGITSESLTDQIWKTPLILPPPVPKDFSLTDTQSLEALKKSLNLEGTLTATIRGENNKLSWNQLVWVKQTTPPSTDGGTAVGGSAPPLTAEQKKDIKQNTKKSFSEIVTQVLENKKNEDIKFREQYSSIRGEELVGNLLAWMDPETKEDGDGRDKNQYYSSLDTPYTIKNAPLASESELSMVKGFDDTLVSLLSENFTVQPTSGLNVNEATGKLLRAVIPELGEMEVERILKRRKDETEGGPFKSADDFWNFLQTMGNYSDAKKRLKEQGIGILEKETSYRVVISAKSGVASKTWVALVGPKFPKLTDTPSPGQSPSFDLSKSAEENAKAAEKKDPAKNDSGGLDIIYLKAE